MKRKIRMSPHATRQAQKRGIPEKTIAIVVKYGTKTRCPGQDGYRVTMKRKTASSLKRVSSKESNSQLEKAAGVTLVVINKSYGWLVTTVYHKTRRQFEQRSYNHKRFARLKT